MKNPTETGKVSVKNQREEVEAARRTRVELHGGGITGTGFWKKYSLVENGTE